MQGLAAANPRQAAQYLRNMGRDGDTDVVHVNEREKVMLEAMGGRGTINPMTGLREYATADNFDMELYLQQRPDVAAAIASGTYGGSAWDHYLNHGKAEGTAGNAAEVEARNQGYEGEFGQGGYNAYKESYYDHDNDPSTQWVAPNESNINRQGQDVSQQREAVREAGYTGPWGAKGALGYVDSMLSEYGLDPSGDIQTDATAILWAMNRQPQQQTTQQQEGGVTGGPTLEYGNDPAYQHRNYANALRLATPANLKRYYMEQGINTLGGDEVYGTRGGEHLFFPSRSYRIDPTGGTGGSG